MILEQKKISVELEKNISAFEDVFSNCSDIKKQAMSLGKNGCIGAWASYVEVTVNESGINAGEVGRFVASMKNLEKNQIVNFLKQNRTGLFDMTTYQTIEDAAQGMLTGDVIMFVDGIDFAIKIPDKGYPAMSLQETDSEKVIRGSNEGFADSIKVNTAIIRRRLKSTRLKCAEYCKGVRSHTNIDLLYVEDLAKITLVNQMKKRLDRFVIDQISDTGVIEQLSEEKWYSPFPQFQTTRRPDVAVNALLQGRLVILSDNSPTALIIPATMNDFFKTADDYYNRTFVSSFARIIRYVSAFLSLTIPGLYLAVTNFHTQILPTSLLLSFYEARIGCPFPQVLEVLMMEMAFELLREAGIRLPGAMGNAIGIVGGLIIGQAAVDANLVSPIVVILVAFTALCSFVIPSEEFAFSFRLLKFVVIIMSAWLGFFGFLISIYAILVHLAKLKSFGYSYLTPFVGPELNGYEDEKDSIVRWPLFKLTQRIIYSKKIERTKLRKNVPESKER